MGRVWVGVVGLCLLVAACGGGGDDGDAADGASRPTTSAAEGATDDTSSSPSTTAPASTVDDAAPTTTEDASPDLAIGMSGVDGAMHVRTLVGQIGAQSAWVTVGPCSLTSAAEVVLGFGAEEVVADANSNPAWASFDCGGWQDGLYRAVTFQDSQEEADRVAALPGAVPVSGGTVSGECAPFEDNTERESCAMFWVDGSFVVTLTVDAPSGTYTLADLEPLFYMGIEEWVSEFAATSLSVELGAQGSVDASAVSAAVAGFGANLGLGDNDETGLAECPVPSITATVAEFVDPAEHGTAVGLVWDYSDALPAGAGGLGCGVEHDGRVSAVEVQTEVTDVWDIAGRMVPAGEAFDATIFYVGDVAGGHVHTICVRTGGTETCDPVWSGGGISIRLVLDAEGRDLVNDVIVPSVSSWIAELSNL